MVLAGGRGRRLGGPAKPVLPVAGTPMLLRVLSAAAAAEPRIVVGPPELAEVLPAGVRLTWERPPGGGPVAAMAAGLDLVERGPVAVLAADLPLLSPMALDRLRTALGAADGVVYVDGAGRRQWLCGMWRLSPLRARLGVMARAGPLAGRSLGSVLGDLRVAVVAGAEGEQPPWYDCDTPEELSAAERMREET